MQSSSILLDALHPSHREQFESFVRREEAERATESLFATCSASCLFSSCSITAPGPCTCKCFIGRAKCKCKG
jgi:hypothetical protein